MLDNISIVLGIVGSIALFLFSVFSFSEIIKHIAGPRIKSLLQSLTSNPFKGTLLGLASTAILQASAATVIITASLSNAGLISLYNSLGIIFGANIGTTITSQLIAFNIMSISPFIIIIGIMTYFSGRNFKKFGKPIIYFGLLFFSIYLISYFVSFIDKTLISSLLSNVSSPFIAILVGIVATIILQSSSVVSGIVLVLTGAGHIDLIQAIAMILGANIGTTFIVMLASTTMNLEAKKVALSHFLFNFIGVLIFLPFINYLSIWVSKFGGDLVHQVANTHLIFNIVCTTIFLIFIKPFHSLINILIKK
jgi:phosphate:Na+ symporter